MKRKAAVALIAIDVLLLWLWMPVLAPSTITHRWEPPKFPWYVDGLHHNLFIYSGIYDSIPCDLTGNGDYICGIESAIPDQWRGKERGR